MNPKEPSKKPAHEAPKNSEHSSILVRALGMALGTFSSRILGLIRDLLFTALFSRTVTDAWTAAFRLPNMFRRLLGEGSLAVSFVPVFVEARINDESGLRARNLVNSFYTLLLVILVVLTSLGILFPEPVLRFILDENYSQIAGKFELTVRLTQIMFGFIFLMSTYAFFMGILNAMGSYALPAFAPTLWNLAMIVSTLLPQRWFAVPADVLAWGVIAGGFLQVIVLVPSLRRFGYLPRLQWNPRNPDVVRIWKNMVPGMLGMGLSHITTVVNLRFASSLSEGAISYLYLADRLLELPLSLVSVSLGTALLPVLSAHWTRGERAEMTQASRDSLRLNTWIALPAACGLYFLAQPIVELLFQRGQFRPHDTLATVSVLKIYALMLLTVSAVRVLVPSFYAIKNTWLPASISGVCLVFHLSIAPVLMARWQLEGLVLSSFFSGALNILLLSIAYNVLIYPMGWIRLLFGLWKPVIAVLGVALWLEAMSQTISQSHLPWILRLLMLGIAILGAMLIYVSVSWVLKAEEVRKNGPALFNKIKRRFKF